MPNSNSHTPKGWATGAGGFTSWVNVKVYQSGWQYAKRAFRCVSPGVWTEVWSNRPVVTTAAGSSSAFDRITANGAVNPNNFSATPRFYYKKNSDGAYTAGTELTALTGDTSQDVTSTITGLTENTTYNYYLLATNSAGTSDTPTVRNVTTPINCDQAATGWQGTAAAAVTVDCGTCGKQTTVTTTYTKTGCTTYTAITSNTGCVEDACGCKTAGTNGWTNKAQETRVVHCGSYCNGQNQYRQVIEKAGCTDHVATDWTNTGGCTDRVTSRDANNLPNGWVMWMERYGYGQADNRKVVVRPSTRNPYGFYNYVFGDDNYCYSCNPCGYGVTYSVVLCPLTSAYYWVDSSCTADL